jgi:gamma-glutamyltranspeptidase/glutathione hydrolase
MLPVWVRSDLGDMGYSVEADKRPYSPITAIYFDTENGSMWGGASDYGDDYGIAW